MILPGLVLGGIGAGFFTDRTKDLPRRGETGPVQVRLELAAQTLDQVRRMLEDLPERAVDEGALVLRAVGEACAGCSAREHCRSCTRLQRIPGDILRKPLLTPQELPFRCRKAGRVLAELHRAQEQLRLIQADRLRQREYRLATRQQYGFLSDFLHELSDSLPRRGELSPPAYDPVVSVWSNRRRGENGDCCAQFAGMGNRYYIILCDGMGTGTEARQEGKTAISHLRKLLSCGFPAKHALQSLNSFCVLGSCAASVTVDLAEAELDTGKITLYKWGAAPSWLVSNQGGEKLGEVTPPPGLSLTEGTESCVTVLLRRRQLLLLVSDGVEEAALREACAAPTSPADLAQKVLKATTRQDDATLVTIQLLPTSK